MMLALLFYTYMTGQRHLTTYRGWSRARGRDERFAGTEMKGRRSRVGDHRRSCVSACHRSLPGRLTRMAPAWCDGATVFGETA